MIDTKLLEYYYSKSPSFFVVTRVLYVDMLISAGEHNIRTWF